jgi:hypothetical protein
MCFLYVLADINLVLQWEQDDGYSGMSILLILHSHKSYSLNALNIHYVLCSLHQRAQHQEYYRKAQWREVKCIFLIHIRYINQPYMLAAHGNVFTGTKQCSCNTWRLMTL